MPGISDRRALINAILDSTSVPPSTASRLSSRGVRDTKSALRLRRTEYMLFKRWDPALSGRLAEEARRAVIAQRPGNHYYYRFCIGVLNIIRDKTFIMKCRSEQVIHSYQMANQLLEIKIPREEYHLAITSLPEGYQRVHNMYIAIRSMYDKLYSMHSNCGRYRGKLQSINVKLKADDDFEDALNEWISQEDKNLGKRGRKTIYSDKMKLGQKNFLRMARISDLIYVEFNDTQETIRLLLTSNHFARCADFLKQVSNIILGILLSYGMEGNYDSEQLVNDTLIYMREMFKIGQKDDLAVGEAGKAVSDLYKAMLSQTPELPWDNFKMMMETYSEVRQENAARLWSDFNEMRHDPDIMMNLSYVWKTAAQPDSSIRADFVELTKGLSEPNPVAKNAPELIEVAIRRAVLVGTIRENRQVHVEPQPGFTVAKELMEAVSHSFPTEKQLRLVTHGMMRGMKLTVKGVFPSPHDVSHLMFKDKSSSKDGEELRYVVKERCKEEERLMELEDEVILANAKLSADLFLESIKFADTKKKVNWQLKATANDILTSLDENIADVFSEAEAKFKLITRTLRDIRGKYGEKNFSSDLVEWAKENSEAVINTATEPKYGEVHKRSVRIFYMFEKGMKTFLSQFERIARIVGYYIKGAEIVKGERAREKHMNILSSAHKAEREGILAYQILFDLSKFSQKFNHKIIDAATKVIGELVDYPEYSQISDLFKASFLYVSSRHTDKTFVGVLGAFEGFLNFLWTNIHATVMDIALRKCGRSGDLAAYSDDGLLMFTMNAKPDDPKEVIREELNSIVNSIKETYADFGLDFNLGKTLISRTLAEFLGIIQYKGHRFPTWMKELCHLGIPDETSAVKSLGQEMTDVSSQMSALIKAGMPAFSATLLGYSELFMGPGRRLTSLAAKARGKLTKSRLGDLEMKATMLFLCLNQSFGGVRIPDPLTVMMTSDFDPIAEMLYDLEKYLMVFPDVTGLKDHLLNKITPTRDYTPLFMGSSPVHTEGIHYSAGLIRGKIASEIRRKLSVPTDHPLSKTSAPNLHTALEEMENIYLPSVVSITRYIVPSILYEKILAPTKSSSIARLLRKSRIRMIQHNDSQSAMTQLLEFMSLINKGGGSGLPTADEIYKLSYPELHFAPSLPSSRSLAELEFSMDPISYEVQISKGHRMDESGSYRLLNQAYHDELVPPLVTTDVNFQHTMNAPDLVTHCMRGLYSELVSSSSQGHDLTPIVQAVCELNKCPLIYPSLLTSLQDMRKIAVANRKKSIHRVYWSEPTKSAIRILRMGPLNHYMTSTSNFHYSLIVTSVLARVHFLLTSSKIADHRKVVYYKMSKELIERTKLLPMKQVRELNKIKNPDWRTVPIPGPVQRAISNETVRSIDNTKAEFIDNLLIGRMGMLPDFQGISQGGNLLDPLRYAIVWSVISKLDSFIEGAAGVTGVTSTRLQETPIDNIPIELINMAIIYRSYKLVRKGPLNKLLKSLMSREGESHLSAVVDILPEPVAEESLNAASQLGMLTSLTKYTLRSVKSALVYNSMLIADGINMVYYSLDAQSETSDTVQISPGRVNAMRRVADAVISQAFLDETYDLESDMCKIILMLLRGSMRGSVHREEPFNFNVAMTWGEAFFETTSNFLHSLPPFYHWIVSQRDPKNPVYPKIQGTELIELERQLRYKVKEKVEEEKGAAEQYDQLIKFFLKMGEWGHLQALFLDPDYDWVYEKIWDVYETMLKPAIMMARTVSYSTVNKAIAGNTLPPQQAEEFQLSLEDSIEKLTSGLHGYETWEDYLHVQPHDIYREYAGPLGYLRIRVCFPPGSDLSFSNSLPYSLSLPLLFASGRRAFRSISDLGKGNSTYHNKMLSDALSEFSLPLDPDGIELAIISHLSERDAWAVLSQWREEHREPSMVVLEIPPDATAFSLGIIGFLTSQHYSYATVALSSDLSGASIYVVVILEGDLPKIQGPIAKPASLAASLGDGAIFNYLSSWVSDEFAPIASLSLSPMQQVGIPVFAFMETKKGILSMKVEEELLDRHQVSFVESSRVSKSAQLYASLLPDVTAYIIRAHRMKNAENEGYINVISSYCYFLKGLYPSFNLEELKNFIVELFNNRGNESEQNFLLRHLAAPIVSLPELNPSSLPSDAQLREVEIPDLNFDYVACWPGTEQYACNILDHSGTELLQIEERGLLASYLKERRGEWDLEQAWRAVSIFRPDPGIRKVFSGKASSRARRRPAPGESSGEAQYRVAHAIKPLIMLEKKEEILATQALFQGTFGEAVFSQESEIPETPEERINLLKGRLHANGVDDFTVSMLNKLEDEDIIRLSDLSVDALEEELINMAEDERERMMESYGVV